MSLALARAGAAGRMLRKRSKAEGSEGSGEVGRRLAREAEVSLAQPGWGQSADAGRCHGSRERSPCHLSLPALVCEGQAVPAAGNFLTVGVGGHRMCTKVITIPNL